MSQPTIHCKCGFWRHLRPDEQTADALYFRGLATAEQARADRLQEESDQRLNQMAALSDELSKTTRELNIARAQLAEMSRATNRPIPKLRRTA